MGKMKKTLLGAAFVAAALSMNSCATRESAINDLQNFSYDLRDKSQYYTVAEWQKAGNRFLKIRRRISKYQYTVAERQKIGKLEGQCAKYMVKGAKDGILDHVLGIGSEVQGILDGSGWGK